SEGYPTRPRGRGELAPARPARGFSSQRRCAVRGSRRSDPVLANGNSWQSNRRSVHSFLKTSFEAAMDLNERGGRAHCQRLIWSSALFQHVEGMDEVPKVLQRPARLFGGLAHQTELDAHVYQVAEIPLLQRLHLSLLALASPAGGTRRLLLPK